jgi:hypothetical protein
MRFDAVPVGHTMGVDHVFYNNTVVLNYGPYSYRKVYYFQQAATAVPFPEAGTAIPAEYLGLSALQLKTVFGKSIGGELAPPNVLTVPSITGLLDP